MILNCNGMLMLRVVLSGESQAQLKDLQQNHIHPLIRRRALVLQLVVGLINPVNLSIAYCTYRF